MGARQKLQAAAFLLVLPFLGSSVSIASVRACVCMSECTCVNVSNEHAPLCVQT